MFTVFKISSCIGIRYLVRVRWRWSVIESSWVGSWHILPAPCQPYTTASVLPEAFATSTLVLGVAGVAPVPLVHKHEDQRVTMAPVLAYWDVRGLAQPIRLLLEYTGTEFKDKYYKSGPAPDYDKSCWFDIKETLGFDFPNLPYYIDGDVKVTQSNAIMRYIARKHDLCGKTDEEQVRIDILENQAMDFYNGFVRLCYGNFDTDKDAYLEALPKTIERFSKFLGTRPWFAGDNISFVDFIMYELLDQHLLLDKDCLKNAKNLQDFLKHFEDLEPIKKYMASRRFLKAPINNKMAKFGNK